MRFFSFALVTLVTSFILCSVVSPVQAQFGRALENAINRNINKKIDDAVDDAFEKGSQKKKNKTDKSTAPENTTIKTSENGETIEISTDDADILIENNNTQPTDVKPSSFLGSFDLVNTHIGKNGKEESSTTNLYIDSYKMAMIMPTEGNRPTMCIITDRQNGTMTTLNSKEKQAIVTKIPKINVKNKKDASGQQALSFTKTGETKTIDGHLCQKYLGEDEKYQYITWITSDINVDMSDVFGVQKQQQIPDMPEGTALETTLTDKKNNDRIEIRIKNLKKGKPDAAIFSTSGYELIDVTSFGNKLGK